ncbi:acyl-CoA synthetase [Pigmentiphaga soli]|uniref:Acyl-CoA synthetase n=1 Tax=Pigmentiphaga soli TaxID=1007095 RepID=A0ABP8GLF1_9BURK
MTHSIPWGHELAVRQARYGGRPAVIGAEGQCTHAELATRANGLARHLLARGVRPGEPVAVCLANGPAAVWASYGTMLAGAAETPVNPHLSPPEIAYCLRLASVRHVVTDLARRQLFGDLGCEVHLVDDGSIGTADCDPALSARADDWGRLVFTSGTTGKPKAIVCSHRGRWTANLLLRASLPYQPGAQSSILLMTPFPFGAALLSYAYLDAGASVHLFEGVDVGRVRALLDDGRVDAIFAPPTVLAKLADGLTGHRYGGVRAIFCGTSTLLPDLYRRAREIFGPVVRVTYGKSEVYNPITYLSPEECDAWYGADPASQPGVSLGWAASGVELAVRDGDGRDLPPGETGEIHIRAQHMLAGHIDAEGFHAVGPGDWHATGDMGLLSAHGELMLTGRAHDVIKSGGYKIFPQEIETVIGPAAGSAPVVAVGLPSEYWGQVIVAVAERPPAGWDAAAASAAGQIAKFKRPRAYLSVDALPRGSQDKIQRARVVDLVLERYRLEDGPHPRLLPREPV